MYVKNLKLNQMALMFVVACACAGHSLLELEVKNAWLSVDGLNAMPTLTSLTLEFIRLDDEDLNKVNNFFPCLTHRFGK